LRIRAETWAQEKNTGKGGGKKRLRNITTNLGGEKILGGLDKKHRREWHLDNNTNGMR